MYLQCIFNFLNKLPTICCFSTDRRSKQWSKGWTASCQKVLTLHSACIHALMAYVPIVCLLYIQLENGNGTKIIILISMKGFIISDNRYTTVPSKQLGSWRCMYCHKRIYLVDIMDDDVRMTLIPSFLDWIPIRNPARE